MRAGDRLAYSWRMVRSPRGSHPALRHPGTRRPVLQTGVPGRYEVRLTVRETSRRSPAKHLPADTAAAQESDRVAVSADVPLPPIGAQVNTLIASGGLTGVNVNGTLIAAQTPGEVQLVVLDRGDPANPPLYNQSFGGTAADIQAAVQTVKTNFDGPDSEIVISGSAASGQTLVQSSALTELNDLLTEIGASPVSSAQLAQLQSGFSAVGYPGLQPGAGAENIGNQLGPPVLYGQTAPGDLAGYFTLDSADNYDFNFTDYLPFSTDVPANNPVQGQVTMSVHGVQYQFPQVASGKGGFAVVQCNATALTCTPYLFPIDGFSPSADATLQQQFAQYLSQLPPNTLILIQSDGGALFPDTTSWANIANAIQDLGGTADLVNRMQVGQSYALVGGNALQEPALETQTDTTNSGPGTLSGLLSRNTAAAFAPFLQDPTGNTFDFSLLTVAFQQPTTFPNWRTPARLAADNYIVTHSNPPLCNAAAQDCTSATVEQQYWANENIGNWESDGVKYVTSVSCPNSGTSLSGVSFTKADCEADMNEWLSGANGNGNEFLLVDNLNGFINNLKAPFQQVGSYSAPADLSTIASTIEKAVNPGSSPTGSFAYAIIEDMFNVISAGLQPEGTVVEQGVTGVIGAAMALGTDLSAESDGTLDAQAVQDKASELANDLADRIANTLSNLDTLRNIIVSDWGKLDTVGTNAGNVWAWSNDADQIPTVAALTVGAEATFYQKLMPAAYHLWDFGSSTGSKYECGKGGQNGIQTPFPQMPASDYWGFTTGFSTAGGSQPTPVLDYRGLAQWAFNSEPPASLTEPLFESTSAGGIGMNPQWFFTRNFKSSGSYAC
jgi:hypothetical protein